MDSLPGACGFARRERHPDTGDPIWQLGRWRSSKARLTDIRLPLMMRPPGAGI